MPESPGTVAYEHEPTPGIPAARNRALDASAGDDLLVFIDDDERPGQTWLALLLETFVEHSAVAVVGSVRSVYEAAPSAWVQAGRFFERRRPPTGTSLSVAATNNLLLDLRVVRRLGLAFDRRMGLNGGDDTLFTRKLARHGLMVWCDEAVVTDVVPAHRSTREWVVRRALRSGNSWSLTSVRLATRTRPAAPGHDSCRSGRERRDSPAEPLGGRRACSVAGWISEPAAYAPWRAAPACSSVPAGCRTWSIQRPGSGRRIERARR